VKARGRVICFEAKRVGRERFKLPQLKAQGNSKVQGPRFKHEALRRVREETD
jgi:hypothetical protein